MKRAHVNYNRIANTEKNFFNASVRSEEKRPKTLFQKYGIREPKYPKLMENRINIVIKFFRRFQYNDSATNESMLKKIHEIYATEIPLFELCEMYIMRNMDLKVGDQLKKLLKAYDNLRNNVLEVFNGISETK